MALRQHQTRVLAAAALFIVAVFVRLLFWRVPPYGDEGIFYYTARHLWLRPPNVHDLYVPDSANLFANVGYRPLPVFWYRPLEFLLLWPWAQFGFDGYRLGTLLYTSLLPVFSAQLLHAARVRAALVYGASLMVALAPSLVTWTTLGLPDGLTATLFVGALWAMQRRRALPAGVLFLAAAWTKETALVGIFGLLVYRLFDRRREARANASAFRLNRMDAGLCLTLALGPLPVLFAVWSGGLAPGWYGEPTLGWMLERLFLIPLLLLVILAGLRWPETRRWAILSLLYPAFYLAYATIFGRQVNAWYLVLPQALAILGSAVVLDVAWNRARAKDSRRATIAVKAGAVALACLFAVLVVVPTGTVKAAAFHPFTLDAADGLADALAYERTRDAHLREALGALPLREGATIFSVDVYGSFVWHPMLSSGAEVWMGETDTVQLLKQRIDPWAPAIELQADATIVAKNDFALNRALREVYSDCVVLDNEEFSIIDGRNCIGRSDQLEARWSELEAGA